MVKVGIAPPVRGDKKSIAQLEHEIISSKPYTLTQEEVQFYVYTQRQRIPAIELKTKQTIRFAQTSSPESSLSFPFFSFSSLRP